MINIKNVNRFCNGDITQIENYEKAINDKTQTWDCHHRKETDEGLSAKQLKELGLLFDRPASELIFLTRSEHSSLHYSGENNPMYGKQHSEETKKKQSESLKGEKHPNYGKQHLEESKKKTSNSIKGNKRIIKDGKGAYCKPEELEYYLNNGWQLQKYKKKE